MRGRPNPELKTECIRFRAEERKSLREIHEITGAPKGSLSGWLKDYPLTDEEKRAKMGQGRKANNVKDRGEKSKFYLAAKGKDLSRLQKAKIAESAVLFRLTLHGFNVFGSPFDGDKTDWLVEIPETGDVCKLQVKWAGWTGKGLPTIPLRCCEGHNKARKYKEGEFDFIVGYDLFTDTAYVYSWEEVNNHKTMITVTPDGREKWEKLRM